MTDIKYVTRYFPVLLGLFLFSTLADARPKIGLALGGGGAKGAAHIGVLKILEQHNIPIDYIAGTSIGSVVGGMYATGLSADEVETLMFSTPWEQGYSDSVPREKLPWRIKQQNDKFNIPLEMGIEHAQLKMPSGLLQGQKAMELLRGVLGVHPNFDSFDDLAIPYRAVATDLASYRMVVLDKGNLIAAMQASSSVPGALAPAEMGSLLLVDGGITQNLPVDVVRSMGADIVIAVDIGSELLKKEDLNSTIAVISQLSSFLTNQNTVEQKTLLTNNDFLLLPDIEGLSTTDWSLLEAGLVRGEAAANSQLGRLASLSLDDASYQEYLSERNNRRGLLLARSEQVVTEIRLSSKSNVAGALILEKLQLETGTTIDASELNAAIDRVYSIDEFQRVNAYTLLENGEKTLHVEAEGKSWGPNFLKFGIGWEDDFDNQSDLNFDVAYIMRDLTDYGGEWRSQMELGEQKVFDTEFYLPLDENRNFYSSSNYLYRSFEWDFFLKDTPSIPIEQSFSSISQGIGYNYTQQGYTEIGLIAEAGEFSNEYYLGKKLNYSSYGGYFKFGFDTLDSISFPTKGTYFKIDTFLRKEDIADHEVLGESDSPLTSLFVDVNWKSALNFGNHSIVAKASYAETVTRNGDESVYFSQLGGFLNLSGYSKGALTGSKKVFTAGIYQFDLGKSFLELENLPLYLGISFETGNVWQEGDSLEESGLILSSSVFLGLESMLGPVALGYGRASTDSQAFYFYLGKNF